MSQISLGLSFVRICQCFLLLLPLVGTWAAHLLISRLCTCWENILHLSSVSLYSLQLILSNSSPPFGWKDYFACFAELLSPPRGTRSGWRSASPTQSTPPGPGWLCTLSSAPGWPRLVFALGRHLVQDLQFVSSVGHVVRPCVLLVLGCKQLLVRLPLTSSFKSIYQQPKISHSYMK